VARPRRRIAEIHLEAFSPEDCVGLREFNESNAGHHEVCVVLESGQAALRVIHKNTDARFHIYMKPATMVL
jgi:hypothetical protein